MYFSDIFAIVIIALIILLFIIIAILIVTLLYLNESVNILSDKVNIYGKSINIISKEIDANKEDIIAYITETTNEKIAPLLKKQAHYEKKILDLEVLYNAVSMKYDCLYDTVSKSDVAIDQNFENQHNLLREFCEKMCNEFESLINEKYDILSQKIDATNSIVDINQAICEKRAACATNV